MAQDDPILGTLRKSETITLTIFGILTVFKGITFFIIHLLDERHDIQHIP